MSTWVFSPSSLSTSTYCVKGSFRLYFGVVKRAIIAAWLSQFMTTFLILISANIMWDAALPTAKLQLETQSHYCQDEWLLRECHYDYC